jgi:hypothetical protein
MFSNNEVNISLKEYREYKTKLHGEIMDICGKYLNKLSIVSILGIIEIVKQEVMELDQATRRDLNFEKSDDKIEF